MKSKKINLQSETFYYKPWTPGSKKKQFRRFWFGFVLLFGFIILNVLIVYRLYLESL